MLVERTEAPRIDSAVNRMATRSIIVLWIDVTGSSNLEVDQVILCQVVYLQEITTGLSMTVRA